MTKNQVFEAFEILLEEIETVANGLNEEGARAFQKGAYDRAERAIEEGKRLADFREKVKFLQKEWIKLFSSRRRPILTKSKKKPRKKSANTLPKGLRTPEEAFRMPILESLVELGGSAPMSEVLNLVERKMKRILNDYDRQLLPSDRRSVRWRNTAQWCRNAMVKEGLMKDNSPYGIWEISDKGRSWLADKQKS